MLEVHPSEPPVPPSCAHQPSGAGHGLPLPTGRWVSHRRRGTQLSSDPGRVLLLIRILSLIFLILPDGTATARVVTPEQSPLPPVRPGTSAQPRVNLFSVMETGEMTPVSPAREQLADDLEIHLLCQNRTSAS